MTIGTNMPFKLKFQALARETAGKEGAQSDQKEMPGVKEQQNGFGLLLKSVEPKRSSEPKHSIADEEKIEPKNLRDGSDDTVAPISQGLFAQPIIALEQMLDRQQHNEKFRTAVGQSGELEAETAPISVSTTPEPSVTGDDLVQEQAAAEAIPPGRKPEPGIQEQPSDIAARTIPSPAPLKPAPELAAEQQTNIMPEQVEAVTPPVSVAGVRPEKRESKPVAEILKPETANAADKPLPQQATPPLSQAAARPSIANGSTPVVLVGRPAVTDIQVISDRSAGAARTLVIQLQPVELGTVTARLRLTSEGMHIQISAANAAMAEHLSNDREKLGKALHKAGVADDTSTVTISIVDRSQTGMGGTQTGQQNLNGQDQQMTPRGNSQGQSAFQNTPGERSANQHIFGEIAADDHVEMPAKTDVQRNSSRGLVV